MKVQIDKDGIIQARTYIASNPILQVGQVAKVGRSYIFNPTEEARKQYSLYGKEFAAPTVQEANAKLSIWIASFHRKVAS